MKRRTHTKGRLYVRKGILLPVAAVIAMLWTLATYQFSEQLLCHLSLAFRTRNEIVARTCLTSVSTWLAAFSESPAWATSNTQNNLTLFSNISEGTKQSPILYCIVSPAHKTAAGTDRSFRFGLEDESSKLDINWLAREAKDGRARLMHLPGMTVSQADSLLDWIDADDIPREFGAERNYYFSNGSAIQPPNAEIQDLSELINVRDISRELIFGTVFSVPEDGLQQGWKSEPIPSNGAHGWARFLTTYAGEVAAVDSDKIAVNSDDLPKLYEELKEQLGEDGARFILAVRLAGILERPAGVQRKQAEKSVQSRIEEQLRGKAVQPDASVTASVVAGLNLSRAPEFEIQSLFDLIGTNVRIVIAGNDEVLASPWAGTRSGVEKAFALLDKTLDPRPTTVLRGRLNLNTAPRELLRGLAELPPSKLNKLLETRDREFRKQRTNEASGLWLITQDVLSIQEMRRLAPFLTDRGNVFTGTICAFLPGQGAVYRRKVTIDATVSPPTVSKRLNLPPGDASLRKALQNSDAER